MLQQQGKEKELGDAVFYSQVYRVITRRDRHTDADKATGDDGISAKLLRIAAPAISPSLSKLLNLGLSTKTFSTAWKVANVTPVFKGNGSRNDKNNYRPISVHPILSKILEKHICEYLFNFLKE